MSIYGFFGSSTLGMMSQSHALSVIGTNIANLNTGGFKKTETRFATVLSDSWRYNQSDIGGVTPKDYQQIDLQGYMVASQSSMDLAISGRGFFILNTELDGSGQTLYTRDGSFQMRTNGTDTATADDGSQITISRAYLVDKNGYYVMGLTPDANGDFSATGALAAMRLDQFAFSRAGETTTTAALQLNLPANAASGDLHRFSARVVDDAGDEQTVQLDFTKSTTLNEWTVTPTTSADPVAQVDTVTIAGTVEAGDTYTITVDGNNVIYTVTGLEGSLDGVRSAIVAAINADATVSALVTAAAGGGGQFTLTAASAGTSFTTGVAAADGGGTPDNTASATTTTANVGDTVTGAATTLSFDANAQLTAPDPATINYALTFAGGSTVTFDLDVSLVTQFAGDFMVFNYSQNGIARADMRAFSFDEFGHVIGSFDNATTRTLYRLPLASFTNPNGLEMLNGNVFRESEDSGSERVVLAGALGFALFSPNTREISNVDLADEFTRMIMTQTAYNSSATVFRTADEMTQVARDLKR